MNRRERPWVGPVAVGAMAFFGVAVLLAAYTIAKGRGDNEAGAVPASATQAAPAVTATVTVTPAPARVVRTPTPTATATVGPNAACGLLPQAEVEAAFEMKLRADRENTVTGEACTYRAVGVERAIGASVRSFGSVDDARRVLALKDWDLLPLPAVGVEAYAIGDWPGSYTVLLLKGGVAMQLDVFDIEHKDLLAVTAALAAKVGARM